MIVELLANAGSLVFEQSANRIQQSSERPT